MGARWVCPEVGKTISIYNRICFLVANLGFILLNQCQLQFFYTVPSPMEDNQMTYCLPWIQCPLSLILYTFGFNFHLTPVHLNHHRAEGSRRRRHCWTDVDLWERAGSCLAISPTLSLEFLPSLLLLSLATLICCGQGGGLFVTWLFVLNC